MVLMQKLALRSALCSRALTHILPACHTCPLAPPSLVVRRVSQTLTGKSECPWARTVSTHAAERRADHLMHHSGAVTYNSLYVNYTDFEKAFNSIRHPLFWKILRTNRFSLKVINILKEIYTNNQSCVIHKWQQSEWFHVRTCRAEMCAFTHPLLQCHGLDK